jgi:hypothetical protein
LFPTVLKVDVQNTSTWRDSGRVVQLAFMSEHTVLRGETAMASKLDLHWVQGGVRSLGVTESVGGSGMGPPNRCSESKSAPERSTIHRGTAAGQRRAPLFGM